MIRSRRLWLLPASIIAVVAIAALAWQWRGAGWLMPALATRIAATTGLQVETDGPVTAHLLPRLGVRAAGVRMLRSEGGDRVPLIRADVMEADFSWMKLLRGEVQPEHLRLLRSRVLAIPLHPPVDLSASFVGPAIDLDLTAEGVSARIVAHPDGDTLALDRVSLRAGGIEADGSGRLALHDPVRLVANADLTSSSGDRLGAVAVAASYSAEGLVLERAAWHRPDGFEAQLFGFASADGGEIRFEGGADATSETAPGETAAGSTDASARLDGTFGADGLTLAIDDLDIRRGASRLTGRATLASGAPPRLSAELRLDRLDLAAPGLLPGPVASWLAETAAAADVTLRLRIAEIASGQRIAAEGIVVDAAGQGGTITLRELAVRSLGGAPLQASGRLVLGSPAVVGIDSLRASYGPLELSGQMRADLSQERPQISGDVAVGPLDLNALLAGPKPLPPEPMTRRAAAAMAAQARQVPPQPGWSQSRLELPTSLPIDVDLVLAASRITFRRYRLDSLHARVQATARQLAISEATGSAYGGRVDFSGRFDLGDRPHVAGQALLAGADLAALFADLAGVDGVSGRGEVGVELAADGASAAELVSTLSGNLSLRASDGAVAGLDLPAASQLLKRLKRPADIIELARAAGGGRTPFASLSGHFRIDEGMARTDDLDLAASDAVARLRGSFNLPAWTLDFVNEFQLTDPPGLPPLVLTLKGPIGAPRRVFDISRLQSYLLHGRQAAPAP